MGEKRIGGTVWVPESLQNVVSNSIASDMNFTPWQGASLLSAVSVGNFLGVGSSSVFGERLGRRLPTIIASGGSVAFRLLTTGGANV